jgi:replicative superfamily II helicase
VARRYLAAGEVRPVIVDVPGGRGLDAEIFPAPDLEEVAQALLWRAWGNPPARKSLLFCNTRREVESTAAYLRQNLGYEASIFVHYSNLDSAMRRSVEEDFAQAGTAICVCTSTLELGIDIGSIDDVVLVGPPPSLGSFLQRIGRGNRRSNVIRVLCLARDALEEVQFHAMVRLADGSIPDEPDSSLVGSEIEEDADFFRPSVLIQQIFSLLKQSPTGSVRLADLLRLSPVDLGDEPLATILENLAGLDYLRQGRPNEWRPGPEFDLLLDAHEIYSNIGSDPISVLVIDAYSGRTLARMGRNQVRGPTLQLGGRTLAVAWRDHYRIGVRTGGRGVPDESFVIKTAPMTVSLEMGQAVAAHLNIKTATLPIIQDISAAHVEEVNEHVLYVNGRVNRPPPWDEAAVLRHLRVLAPEAIPFLNLGRFHSLLPPTLAWKTVLDACDIERFERLYRGARLVSASGEMAGKLRVLL